MTCKFQRNYNEPDLTFTVDMADLKEHNKVEYEMVYGAGDTGKWEIILKKVNKDMIGVVEKFREGAKTSAATTTAAKAQPTAAAAARGKSLGRVGAAVITNTPSKNRGKSFAAAASKRPAAAASRAPAFASLLPGGSAMTAQLANAGMVAKYQLIEAMDGQQ